MLASGSNDKTIKIWEVIEGSCISTLPGHTGAIWAIQKVGLSTIASGGQDNILMVWDWKNK